MSTDNKITADQATQNMKNFSEELGARCDKGKNNLKKALENYKDVAEAAKNASKSIEDCKDTMEAVKKARVTPEELKEIAERNEAILKAETKHWAGVDCSIKISREVRRNDPCPCGSGKKAKNCCGAGKKHIPYNIHKPKNHGTK